MTCPSEYPDETPVSNDRNPHAAGSPGVIVFKAAVDQHNKVPDLVITAMQPASDISDEQLQRDAAAICDALHNSLPQGTWRRLMALMIQKQADQLRTRGW